MFTLSAALVLISATYVASSAIGVVANKGALEGALGGQWINDVQPAAGAWAGAPGWVGAPGWAGAASAWNGDGDDGSWRGEGVWDGNNGAWNDGNDGSWNDGAWNGDDGAWNDGRWDGDNGAWNGDNGAWNGDDGSWSH